MKLSEIKREADYVIVPLSKPIHVLSKAIGGEVSVAKNFVILEKQKIESWWNKWFGWIKTDYELVKHKAIAELGDETNALHETEEQAKVEVEKLVSQGEDLIKAFKNL